MKKKNDRVNSNVSSVSAQHMHSVLNVVQSVVWSVEPIYALYVYEFSYFILMMLYLTVSSVGNMSNRRCYPGHVRYILLVLLILLIFTSLSHRTAITNNCRGNLCGCPSGRVYLGFLHVARGDRKGRKGARPLSTHWRLDRQKMCRRRVDPVAPLAGAPLAQI
jgi:hypothetical protein